MIALTILLVWLAISLVLVLGIHLLRRPRSFADQIEDDLEQATAIQPERIITGEQARRMGYDKLRWINEQDAAKRGDQP